MKKNEGVTLVVLVITIIVLVIIAGISITYGISTIRNVTDERTEIELDTVQQAIIQQYTLLLTEKENGITATAISSDTELASDSSRPETLVGTRIADSATTLENYGFSTYKISYSASESSLAYEKYYYSLDEDDLKTLGISSDSESSKDYAYIVNYSTGEVFDIANKTYKVSEDEIYLTGTSSNVTEKNYVFDDE